MPKQAGVVAMALAVAVGGCGDGGLSDRQEHARRDIHDIVEAYVADVAPQAAGRRTETTDDTDCPRGTRLVHRVALDVPADEYAGMIGAFEQYWRTTWPEELSATGEEVAITSSSDWSTRVRAGDDGLEVVGQTACIP